MKIVLNRQFGGFDLSDKAKEFLGKDIKDYDYDPNRTDPKLIECIEVLGEEANTEFSKLVIKEVNEYYFWEIKNFDGMESIRYLRQRCDDEYDT